MGCDVRALLLLACVGITAACGGKAVVDQGGGQGGDGSGAAGPTTGGPGAGPTTTGGGGVCVDDTFGESRAQSGDCQAACEIFFCCAERECAGLGPDDEAPFVAGCIASCNQMMALVAVVDGEACPTTVSTVRAADGNFADICENGIFGEDDGGG